MSFFQNHAGFNITGAKLQLVEVDYKESDRSSEEAGFYLENVDEEFFTEFLDLSFNETKIINILQNAFNEITLRKSLGTNYVSFSLPNNFFKIFQIPVDGKITASDLREHLKWEVSILFPDYDPDNFVIRHVESLKDENIKHAVIFAAFKRFLKVIHKSCVRNNLILKYADNSHIAADAFLFNKSAASVLVDEKYFSVSVLKNQRLIHFKNFEINSVTQLPEVFAEELNHNKNIYESTERKEIYISGDFISENLLKKLDEISGYSFIKINPFEKLKTADTVSENKFLTNKYHTFAAAAGIALRLV